MTKIENKNQYDWAVNRVEQLLPLVDDNTPLNDPNSIELELLSGMVADYSDKHFALGSPSLVDIIQLRLSEMNISKNTLANLLDISTEQLNTYLTEKDEPTLKIGREISRKLNIDPSIVLGL